MPYRAVLWLESYPAQCPASMFFAAQRPGSLEDSRVERQQFPLGTRIRSIPSVNHFPPNQSHPFAYARLGPLPMSPPAGPELRSVARRSYAESLSTNFVTEGAQRTPGVEIGGDEKNPSAHLMTEALFNIVRFVLG